MNVEADFALDARIASLQAFRMSLDTATLTRLLDLPADERAELARQLLQSLEPADVDPDAEQAWAEEIDRRLESVERGEAKLSDWREVVARVERSLKQP